MPVIPIALAAGAWAMGGAAAAGALFSGGVAALTMGEAFALTAAVGATVSAVGAVTHDKTLSTIGMVIGGIGGVGAIANAAGVFGANATVSSVFGEGSAAATGAASAPAATAAAADSGMINSAAGAANAATPGIESVTVTGAAPTAMSGGDIIADMAALGGATASPTASAAPADPASDALAAKTKAPDTAAPAAGSTSQAPTDTTAPPPTTDTVAGTAAPPPGTPAGPSSIPTRDLNELSAQFKNGAPDGTGFKATSGASYTMKNGMWVPAASGGLMSFLSTSGGGMMGMGVVQAAGSFLSGATDTLKPAQVAAYQAQAASNNASAALANRQTANMASGVPTARRMAVTGKVGMMDSTPAGAQA